jgi:cytochrome c551/c552
MKYGLAAVLLVYLPVLGFVICGAAASLVLHFLGEEHGDARSLRLSRELAGTAPFEPAVISAAAVLPFLPVAFLCQRILPDPGPLPWLYWVLPFGALLSGCALLSYSRTVHLGSQELPAAGFRAGAAGLLAVIFASALLFVLLGTLLNPEKLPLIRKYPVFLLSWNSQAAFLLFLALSIGWTGGIVRFFLGHPPAEKEEEDPGYREYVRSTGSTLALGGALAVPVFVVLFLLSLPSTALALDVFAASAAVVIFAMAVALALSLFPEKAAGMPGYGVPVLFVLMFLAVALGYQAAMASAFLGRPAPVQAVEVARIPPSPEIPPAPEPEMEPGRAVFVRACRACHLFATRIAGPAMNDVLPKYKGDVERLEGFIGSPHAVDPNYPPMPPPGIGEEEVEAVARYLMGSIGEKPPPKARPSAAAGSPEKGKAVFDKVCSGCHRFESRVVGPPFNQVVPGYRGDVEALKRFIRNPVKKNPGYPSMPKLGLKEEEIDAVARYLVSHVEKGGGKGQR